MRTGIVDIGKETQKSPRTTFSSGLGEKTVNKQEEQWTLTYRD